MHAEKEKKKDPDDALKRMKSDGQQIKVDEITSIQFLCFPKKCVPVDALLTSNPCQ
jgi:hypothetical protein